MSLNLIGWAERFVSTPSVSRDGNREIAERAAEMLGECGLEARLVSASVEGVEHCNLIADAGPADAPDGLLLLTHLDTVPPGDSDAWTETGGDPWRPVRRDERLYGLGSADAKVDLVCKAAALATLDLSRLRRRLRVVGTFGEEIGLLGARLLVETGETQGFANALVGEPSELTAITAHKGYAVFEARLPRAGTRVDGRRVRELFDGVAAHSSAPALGRNAIEAALARLDGEHPARLAAVTELEGGGAVNQVPARCSLGAIALAPDGAEGLAGYPLEPLVRFRDAFRALARELEKPVDARFDPDHTVCSLGRVAFEEGAPVFRFDVRPVPGVDAEAVVEPLRAVADVRCLRRNPPLSTDPDGPLGRAVADAQERIGLGRRFGTKATCTEAGLLSQAGLEAIVLGAGLSVGNVHRPNEHTRVPELSLARDLYAHVVRALCVEEGE
jgi:acetylornithine deacetylase/succinyl-diaminopimelate desuccinylase-like protein